MVNTFSPDDSQDWRCVPSRANKRRSLADNAFDLKSPTGGYSSMSSGIEWVTMPNHYATCRARRTVRLTVDTTQQLPLLAAGR